MDTKFTLIRSKRKTLALEIKDCTLVVRAPMRMPLSEVEQFIASKRGWIEKKLKASKEIVANRESFKLAYGDEISFRGYNIEIAAKTENEDPDDHRLHIPPGLSSEQIREACINILKVTAEDYLPARTMEIAKTLGLMPVTVKVTSAKTRWGSCNRRRTICLSWRLIMASDGVIDYVIVHELAHLREMNHSEDFWSIVTDAIPDYKIRRKKLDDLGSKLNRERWE